MGYHRAGFEIHGVDHKPQPNYPFSFVMADALEYLRLDGAIGFDAIHASPPCQAYSLRTHNIHMHAHNRLIAVVRELLKETKLPYVIENVMGARPELKNPVMFCGSSFGLRVQRHRLFETNWPLAAPECDHSWQEQNPCMVIYDHGYWSWTGIAPIYGNGGRKATEFWPWAMGCGTTWDDCWMTPDELKEAIPPAYTKRIGRQLKKHLTVKIEIPLF